MSKNNLFKSKDQRRVENSHVKIKFFFFSQQYYYMTSMTSEDLEYGAQVVWTELLVFLELFEWKQSNCCEIQSFQ